MCNILLDGKRYGPGNRSYWEMKEGQVRSRYPNIIRALAKESDPSQRRSIWERFRKQTPREYAAEQYKRG